MIEIRTLSNHRDVLGEGPQWLGGEQGLQRVDIRGRRIHRHDPVTGTAASRALDDDVGFALPAVAGAVVAGVGRSLVRLAGWDGEPVRLWTVEPDRPHNRFNDAKADAAGRIWAGTMSTRRTPGTAALYRFDARGPELAISGATISNGLDWNADADVLYYVDSTTQRIDAIAFDLDRGLLGPRRRLVEIDPHDGLPDGLIVDAQGGIWVALFGGGRIRRYTPGGKLDEEIRLPVSCPTSMAFGGAGLDTLFVTSARHLLSAGQARTEPLAGAVLMLEPGVCGRAPWSAAL